MDKLQLKAAILERIHRPVIPQAEYPAEDLGVVPDGEGIQTELLQKAIDQVHEKGGGRLVLPSGRYRTGALKLKSGVELHLAAGDTVLSFVNEDVKRHYPLVYSHWEATPCYNFSPLIYACDAQDIAVTGKGILDGGADASHWWNWHHQVENAWSDDRPDLQLADRSLLRNMNVEGVPVEERVFGPGHFLRPNFIQTIRCERVLLSGFTLKNSPMWQINPVMCTSLIVEGVTMSSHGANNDGCDPESCDGVHITDCRFDTGDDCISLKSGRDRDGRLAARACEHVLIENNEFADGHGGIALGSEMSGGIRRVLAVNNRFSSPHLTYALRLKTNARRGGRVEEIYLADSVMEHVHGAAVHGTMLYEDGRNGSDLPVFSDITIENIVAHGGDYGIFLEAFDEVPITGLTLRNIRIDGVKRSMRSMNWKDPVIRQVFINGMAFPRPGRVRILGVPQAAGQVSASAENCGGEGKCRFWWQVGEEQVQHAARCVQSDPDSCGNGQADAGSIDGEPVAEPLFVEKAGTAVLWKDGGEGEHFLVPESAAWVRVTAVDEAGNRESSMPYRVLQEEAEDSSGSDRALPGQDSEENSGSDWALPGQDSEENSGFYGAMPGQNPEESSARYRRRRLVCRGMLRPEDKTPDQAVITRRQLADMMVPLMGAKAGMPCAGDSGAQTMQCVPASGSTSALQAAVAHGFLAVCGADRGMADTLCPEGPVTRQEMATVAMQACGVNYRNASSTMPECSDRAQVANNYGTNVARALYFGFMELEPDGSFKPREPVTMGEAVAILGRVADFAGL